MSKTKRNLRVMITILVSVVFLAGCGVRVNAAAYVKSALDARYKNDCKEYIRITGCSEDDAQKQYEDRLEACMVTVSQAEISDELKEEYRKLFGRVLDAVRYSVEDAEKVDGGYIVKVQVEQYAMFDQIEEELSQAVDQYYTQVTEAALYGTTLPTDEEAREKVYELLLDILKDHMNHITYKDAVTIKIHVTKKDQKSYSIESEDLEELDCLLIDLESMGL